MPRVIVTGGALGGQHGNAPVLLDEKVHGVNLVDQRSSPQFLERLAGAIEDGERLEHVASVTSYLELDRC